MLSQEVNDYEKSTQQYFSEISSYESLSKEEEKELFLEYKQTHNPAIRDRICQSNLKFVVNIAKCYKGRGLSFADLISEGNIGMMKAFDRFDIEKDFKFISYAVWWIKQSILEAIEKRNNLSAEELPTDHEKSDNYEDDDCVDVNPEFIEHSYREDAKELEVQHAIEMLSDELSERERNFLFMYFGLNGQKELTLEQIGQQYNLTKERVRQINEKSLKKLRARALNKCITSDIYR